VPTKASFAFFHFTFLHPSRLIAVAAGYNNLSDNETVGLRYKIIKPP